MLIGFESVEAHVVTRIKYIAQVDSEFYLIVIVAFYSWKIGEVYGYIHQESRGVVAVKIGRTIRIGAEEGVAVTGTEGGIYQERYAVFIILIHPVSQLQKTIIMVEQGQLDHILSLTRLLNHVAIQVKAINPLSPVAIQAETKGKKTAVEGQEAGILQGCVQFIQL